MGPFRRGLSLAPLPLVAAATAWAQEATATGACAALRPDWDGEPVGAMAEMVALLSSPIPLILLMVTAVAIRFKAQWAVLVVCLAWSVVVSATTFFDPTGGLREAGMAEGCVGSPVLFILTVSVLCVGAVLATGKPKDKA